MYNKKLLIRITMNFTTTIPSHKIVIDQEKYTNFRHRLHEIPEIAFEEVNTKQHILDFVKKLPNFSKSNITEVDKTGFWFDVFGENTENKLDKDLCLAFRTDLDALPLQEDSKVDYKSKNPGMAHSCGHDGHMTMISCFFEFVLSKLSKLPSNLKLRFLYQPAEEGRNGAEVMIKGGCLEGVDEIYGIHNITTFKVGEIGLVEKTIMAAIGLFDITITGIGGHSSVPNKCKSPITTGTKIVRELNSLTSQEIDSVNRCVVAVGAFNAGQTNNVIPEKATIKGTFRTLTTETYDNISKIIRKKCKAICDMEDSEVEIKIVSPGTITYNNPNLTNNVVIPAIKKAGFSIQTHDLPLMGSEDFSYYQEKIPGVFLLVGCGDEEHKEYLHTPLITLMIEVSRMVLNRM